MHGTVRVVFAVVALMTSARVGLAKCDPSVEPDRADIATARAAVAAACDCAGVATHGAYVRCAVDEANAALVNKGCAGAVKRCASRSTCGKPGFVACCRTRKTGTTSCSLKRSADRCVAPTGGSACVGGVCCPAAARTHAIAGLRDQHHHDDDLDHDHHCSDVRRLRRAVWYLRRRPVHAPLR